MAKTARRKAWVRTSVMPKPAPEAVIGEVIEALAAIDAMMAEPRRSEIDWDYPQGRLKSLRERVTKLIDRLARVIGPDDYDRVAAVARLLNELTVIGPCPGFAHPQQFVLWLGFVPVLCAWGGAIRSYGNDLFAANVDELFISSTGFYSLSAMSADLTPAMAGPPDLYRAQLTAMVSAPDFRLVKLSADAVRHRRAAMADGFDYVAAAVAAGPVNAIALPERYMTSPQSLFA